MTSNSLFPLFFSISCCAFLIHQFVERILRINIPFIDSYLDPLLIMPILLHLVVLERRIVLKNASYRLPLLHITGYFILICLFGEVIFPYINSAFISDLWDIFFYAIGTLFYIIMSNKYTTENKQFI
jgi:hypothetical protein